MLWSQAAFHRGPRTQALLPTRMSVCSLGPDPAAMGGEASCNTLPEVPAPRNSRVSIRFLYGRVFFKKSNNEGRSRRM